MPLPESTISRACRSVADFLYKTLKARGYAVLVVIGPPSNAKPAVGDSNHRLNLFFHRFEPAGFGPDTLPGETAWVRAHCVMTAVAVDETPVLAGENDLRILGEVLRIFHETPVLPPVDVGGETFRPQMVFAPLSLDDINRLWSTQKDTVYRPSIAYEIALAPIAPLKRDKPAPPVKSLGVEVRGHVDTPGRQSGGSG